MADQAIPLDAHSATWADMEASLPQGLPDQARDALREKFFDQNVAPQAMAQGYGYDTVKKQFMDKTARQDKASMPRLQTFASEAAKSLVAPLHGLGVDNSEVNSFAARSAQEAARQGINPAPYQMAGQMAGELPYWALGMEGAQAVAEGLSLPAVMGKAIKVAAGGVIQGSYDMLKTGSVLEGLKGAGLGAGMTAGFEAAGPLWRSLGATAGLGETQAKAVEKVAKGLAGDEDWKHAIDAAVGHERLDEKITGWVEQQVKAAKQAGIPTEGLSPDLSLKGLKIEMTGADGKPYSFTSPKDAPALITRMADHLEAGGSIQKISGDPSAISQFYSALGAEKPDMFDLSARIKPPDSAASSQYVDQEMPPWWFTEYPLKSDEVQAAQTAKASMDLNALISARNSYYHATDLNGFKYILEDGEIRPNTEADLTYRTWKETVEDYGWDKAVTSYAEEYGIDEDEAAPLLKAVVDQTSGGGVSVSRTPRVASKADKAITFVIDRDKMPKTRPYVEGGYGKLNEPASIQSHENSISYYVNVKGWSREEAEQYISENTQAPKEAERNPQFEFEERTYNEPIPLRAVKGVLVDKSALSAADTVSSPDGPFEVFDTLTGKTLQTVTTLEDAKSISEKIPHSDYSSIAKSSNILQEIQDWADKKGIKVKVLENGRDIHSYRAGLQRLPEDQRWSIPLLDQLESLPDSSVRNKVSGQLEKQAPSDLSYKETPLSHRWVGDIPEELAPDQVSGVMVGAGEGNKPSIFYRPEDANRETIFHENLHGHFDYMGISSWLNSHFDSDPMVNDIFHGAFPAEAKALYAGTNGIPEEVFNYAASAVRTNNNDVLDAFARADTDRHSVLDWVTDTSRDILDKSAEVEDSLHKRTLERRLTSVVNRATGQLDDIDRAFNTSDMHIDIENDQYLVRQGQSSQYFPDRASALDYMDTQHLEPLQAPELVQMHGLPEGLPRYAVKTKGPSITNPPVGSEASPPELRDPIKAGTSVFSFWFRPFMDWLGDVAQKHDRFDLYGAFNGVEEAGVQMSNALRPQFKLLKETLGNYPVERQTDFLKWMQAEPAHRAFVEDELHFKPEELADLERFKAEFMGGMDSAHPLMEYIQRDLPRLQAAGWNVDTVFPKGKDKTIMGGLVQSGRLDPRNTNLIGIAALYAQKEAHSSFLAPVLDAAEELVNEKGAGGKPALGQLRTLLNRKISAFRGVPDFTMEAMSGAIEATTDSINSAIGKANKSLPKSLQIPTIDDSPRELVQKYTTFSYAGALALKPAVLIRDALQLFMTSFPILGNYTWKGMGRAFEVAKEGGDADAWQVAQKYGAFIERRDMSTFISGGEEEISSLESIAQKALKATQTTHNSNRLVAFWGHQMKITDALESYRDSGDVKAFTKDSDAWFMNPGMRQKYLSQLESLTPEAEDDFSKRMAADLVGTTQWNYRPGQTPGMYAYTLGRLFGQYGTWPLNYIEYARRFLQGSDKTATMQAMTRLVAAHGAVMAAGASVGIDTSKWVFMNPGGWSGGPLLGTTLSLPSALSSGKEGDESRRNLKELLIWPGFVPGGDEVHKIWQAVTEKDDNVWIHAMGFKSL